MGDPINNSRKEFVYRVGTFFLLIGLGLLVFFMLSEAAEQPQFNYFCGSMVLFIVGFLFRAQYKKAKVSSGRFSILKRMSRRGGGSSASSRESKSSKASEYEEEYDDEEYEDE